MTLRSRFGFLSQEVLAATALAAGGGWQFSGWQLYCPVANSGRWWGRCAKGGGFIAMDMVQWSLSASAVQWKTKRGTGGIWGERLCVRELREHEIAKDDKGRGRGLKTSRVNKTGY